MRRITKLSALALTASVALPAVASATQVPEQSKPAGQIFSDAVAAMSSVKDFHVSGRITEGTQLVLLNMSMSKTGGGGSFQYKGATIEVVVNPRYLYLKADAASWRVLSGGQATGQSVAQLLANKWLKVPVSNAEFSSFANFTFSNKFLPAITKGHNAQQLVKGGLTTYDGRSAIELSDVQHTGKVYVAVASPHYLLGVAAAAGSSQGTLRFTDFGDAPMPTTPTNAIAFPGM
jgi:hypothetical protein